MSGDYDETDPLQVIIKYNQSHTKSQRKTIDFRKDDTYNKNEKYGLFDLPDIDYEGRSLTSYKDELLDLLDRVKKDVLIKIDES